MTARYATGEGTGPDAATDDTVTLLLGGDVMTGRGVDQVLGHPGRPRLREATVSDARTYVELAEATSGPITRPVDPSWPWGDCLRLLDEAAPDVRLVNLETSVTVSDDYAEDKGIHYRMHPDNAPTLAAARLDVCALANNHVLDFGVRGLVETVDTLSRAGLGTAGAGSDASRAWRPAAVDVRGQRVLVWSVAVPSSGVPAHWAATSDRPGIALLPDVSPYSAAALIERIRRTARPHDLLIVSIHWGSNWGYELPERHIRFARQLIDAGVHVVHGHSSHHPRPVEVHGGGLVLYGCGDLVDDYEGIGDYPHYRPRLRLLYLATIALRDGALVALRMLPLRMERMRLRRAGADDVRWLCDRLREISAGFGTRFACTPDGTLALELG